MKDKLVVYYSFTGNTKKVAEGIASDLDADIVAIEPVRKYNYVSALALGGVQVRNKQKIKLKALGVSLDAYDEIVIGTPVWWYSLTPPVRSFIELNDFSGKRVRLFSTHGGDNGRTFENMKEILKGADLIGTKDYFVSGDFDYKKVQGDFE